MKKAICFIWALILVVSMSSSSFASSSYYDAPLLSRPPDSIFDSCCCKKQREINGQDLYKCELTKTTTCPEGSKKYNESLVECPGNLIFTSYK